jgi:hypothetical protein
MHFGKRYFITYYQLHHVSFVLTTRVWPKPVLAICNKIHSNKVYTLDFYIYITNRIMFIKSNTPSSPLPLPLRHP